MNFLDVLITVVFLLILMIPGFILAKTKMLGENADSVFSVLVLYVCQPALVFMAFQKTEYSPRLATNLLIVFGLAMAVHLISIGLFSLIFRNKDNSKKINCLKFASIFGNCGYMGLPFLQSLFGSTGMSGEILIYGGVVIAAFNFLTWSIGVYIMTGDKKQINVQNALVNPTVIALILGIVIFFVAKVPLVNLAEKGSFLDKTVEGFVKSINFLSEMVTPLAMTVIGVKLAKVSLKQLFLDKWAYVVALNKLIIVSLITILLVAFLPVDNVVKYALFFLLSMPSATNTVLFAVRFGGDGESGSVFVLLTTVLSIITIPLMFLVINGLFGIPV
ncbi:MAG: AEC family transporter [Clostridia bacterium]|nr:AEC family transporter [Clostridia bacterium]